MKAVWITRSFLDYRVPVYKELSQLLGGELVLMYNAEVVPERVRAKASKALGGNAIDLAGERRVGPKILTSQPANITLRVPWQPGVLAEVRRYKPDVLIADGFFQWTAPALWVRIRDRVPLVMCYERTAHTERNAQWYRRLYRKWAVRYVDAMCCNGRLCGEYARSLGMPADRITYGHMTADTDGLSSAIRKIQRDEVDQHRQKLGLKGVCFLYVGKLIEPKGLRCLLAAWAEIDPALRAQASLLLVGDGDDRDFLERFCREKGLQNVRFAGAVDYDGLGLYYASADVFIIPTLEDNWSLVVPEAMACGLPVICSKYNGCWPELVHGGRNGWVFDPLRSEDMIRTIEECIHGKEGLTNMGLESRAILKSHTPTEGAASILHACKAAVTSSR